MTRQAFPELDPEQITATRDAVHVYLQVTGAWRATCVPHRKHWWHLPVRPSVRGVTTGMIQANIDFELELDLQSDQLRAQVAGGDILETPLAGCTGHELAALVTDFLTAQGIDPQLVPDHQAREEYSVSTEGYSAAIAASLGTALRNVSAALTRFRAAIPEETGSVQIWPHDFDMAMLWLPGEKIAGQDPADEEASDKQMNFGFTFGDTGIPEPYFYVTGYPFPDALPETPLPAGTDWQQDSLAVLSCFTAGS